MALHPGRPAAGAVAAALTVFAADHRATPDAGHIITGPYARLLAEAADLGPADSGTVYVTAELFRGATPAVLPPGHGHDLSVRWRAG